MTNLYADDINSIYNTTESKNKTDIIEKIDSEDDNKIKVIITNNSEYFSNNTINLFHKDYTVEKDNELDYTIIDSYLHLDNYLDINNLPDELSIINVLSTFEIDEYEKLLEYWSKFTKNTLYIMDTCLENIVRLLLVPNEQNNFNVEPDMGMMGNALLFGTGNYIRRSTISPPYVAKLLTKLKFQDVQMQTRGIQVLLRGIKNNI